MRHFRFTVVIIACTVFLAMPGMRAHAQILNNGFENWTSGEPDNWTTNNSIGNICVTKSTSAHGGSAAIQGSVISFMGFGLPPIIISGTADNPGFPVSQRYGALHGYYKYSPSGGDKFYVSAAMEKNSVGIGGATFIDSISYSSYREFVANITYPGSEVPDSISITMMIMNSTGLSHAGSTFTVDDLSLGAATGVGSSGNPVPAAYALAPNFPNPFNPTTTIGYSLPQQSRVRLVVTDINGRIVADLVNEQEPEGNYRAIFDASSLASGVYFARLSAGTFSATKPMLLMK
jgi:hypothetical protein